MVSIVWQPSRQALMPPTSLPLTKKHVLLTCPYGLYGIYESELFHGFQNLTFSSGDWADL